MDNLDPKLNYQKPGKEPYIFVSYAHADRDRVLSIIKRLDQEGFRRWYDSGIDYTEPWHDVIAERVKNCSVFLNILTTNSAVSKNCQREVYLADKYDKDLFFVLLDNPKTMSLPDGIEMMITPTQYLDVTNPHLCPTEEAFLNKLCGAGCMQKCRKPVAEPPVTEAQVSQPVAKVPEPQPASEVKLVDIVNNMAKFEIDGTTLVKVLHPAYIVTVPDGVTKIGRYAFTDENFKVAGGHNGITTEIKLPESVIELDRCAIRSCTALKTINLPSKLKKIGKGAFTNCVNMSDIVLPQEIQYIDLLAFYDCPNLTIHMSRHTDTSKFDPEWNPDNRPIEYYD